MTVELAPELSPIIPCVLCLVPNSVCEVENILGDGS